MHVAWLWTRALAVRLAVTGLPTLRTVLKLNEKLWKLYIVCVEKHISSAAG